MQKIERYRDNGTEYPSINIKAHTFGPDVETIRKDHSCSKEQAEKAAEWAWCDGQEHFWEDVEAEAKILFGANVRLYGLGRSGGHLCVAGSYSVWTLGRHWEEFREFVENCVKEYSGEEWLLGDIQENRWDEDGARQYNFRTTDEGENICYVDRRNAAIAAGFGDVVEE